MNCIPRIRPQSKRRAINAASFTARYLAEAKEAAKRGDVERAEKLFAKSQYWMDRYERLSRHGGTAG